MLIHAPIIALFSKTNPSSSSLSYLLSGTAKSSTIITKASSSSSLAIASLFATCAVFVSAAGAFEAPQQQQQLEAETLSNIPQTLSGSECASISPPKDCKEGRIQHPKSRKAESCTIKCVTTCIRGGEGSPGEGPLNIRRPMVVFKQGFRSRNYCLMECSDICNLIGDEDYGP